MTDKSHIIFGIGKMYSQKEVNRIFGHIPVKTLRWWGQMGFYGWVNETTDGRGTHREYDLSNLYQIGIVEQLSSLNIPTPGINFFMQRHFRYGIRMSALANDENEFPLVNVEMQMGKILVITKALKGKLTQPGGAESPAYSWGSFLIEGTEELFSGKNWSGIMILIDLAMIKKAVESLIKMG